MSTVSLTEAKAHLGALIDRVADGDTVTITRGGRAVACLTPVRDVPRRPIDLEVLRALTDAMPVQGDGAEALVRSMRNGDRY